MENNIFRKKSLEKIASPDKIDDYLKVSTPSAWMVLAALFLAFFSVAAWCVFGNIPTKVSGVGVKCGEEILCFVTVEDGYSVEPGMKVEILPGDSSDMVFGVVSRVEEPQSAEAVWEETEVGWLKLPEEWVCPVIVEMRGEVLEENVICDMNIILKEQSPVNLLLGGEVIE